VTSFVIFDENDVDVTDEFDIQFKQGTLQLYQYLLTLYTSSSTKNYDGTPLTNDGWYYTGSLAAGHSIQTIEFLGLQTNVGTSKNRTRMTIIDENGIDVTGQYNITASYGDLTVTPRVISVASSTATKAFDGTPLINHDYQIMSGSLAAAESIEVVISGSQVVIGKSVNTIESILIFNNGVDVTTNYSIEVSEGELTVSPY